MGKHFVIAGDDGQLYHVSEDDLRKSHQVADDAPERPFLESLSQRGQEALSVSQAVAAKNSAKWANDQSSNRSDAVHYFNTSLSGDPTED